MKGLLDGGASMVEEEASTDLLSRALPLLHSISRPRVIVEELHHGGLARSRAATDPKDAASIVQPRHQANRRSIEHPFK